MSKVQKDKSTTLGWLLDTALAISIVFIIYKFFALPVVIEGISMVPTLEHRERALVNRIIYQFGMPESGDIVVFKFPADPKMDFIKRVIGLPGDVIEIKNEQVVRNGVPLEEPYVMGTTNANFEKVIVPEGTIFVLGDNRNLSTDSRDQKIGFIELNDVVGRVDFVWWPLTKIRSL
ncbi:signal peptidase I [Effusibacillus lacus]|uniref:Signal peptidase I n=1 Tax=Effusibacillus lacus TaxID=1348429 RepID=A0A292YR37_9BACL|nr:signal peptidase I [Effusibacillus lacus]TCS74977.1 signal peptidase I [Effusibacillus lacus]GAX91646.1 signal peptidase I [Effusibacillus lacus]